MYYSERNVLPHSRGDTSAGQEATHQLSGVQVRYSNFETHSHFSSICDELRKNVEQKAFGASKNNLAGVATESRQR